MLRIQLNESELQELETRLKQAKSQNALIYMDLKIIAFSHQGKSVSEMGELLDLHAHTVRTILKKFKAAGFAGLHRKPRGQPEEKLKAYDKAYWEDILSQPPSSFEKLATPDQNWTYELVQRYLEQYLEMKVTISTIWNHLRKVGFTSGRAKLSITSPDPDYQVKRQRVEALEKKAQMAR
jgi:transposase